MFGHLNNYENRFSINDQEILGIDSVDLSYSNSANNSKILGRESSFTTVNGAVSAQLSISRNLIYVDPILADTLAFLSFPINGKIHYNNKAYGFSKGYLTEYMVNCAVGSIPKVSTNFIIFDEIKSQDLPSYTEPSPPIYIPNQGSISLSCDNSSTNRVVGFDYAIKISRKPVYIIGSKDPSEVVTFKNIEYSASVQIDVDDAFLQNSFNFLSNRENKTVSFSIKDRTLINIIQTLNIPNASLIGESLSSSADGGVKLTLNYIGHS